MHTKYLLIIFLILMISPAMAIPGDINMIADAGETYIKWDWEGNMSNNDVFLDGNQITVEDEISYYYLGDLNPEEYHILTIINRTSDTTVAEIGVSTLHNSFQILILFLFVLIIALLVTFVQEIFAVILMAAFGGFMDLYLITILTGYGLFWYLAVGLEIYILIMVFRAIHAKYKDDLAWM